MATAVFAIGAFAVYPIATNLASNWLTDALKDRIWLGPIIWAMVLAFGIGSFWMWKMQREAGLRSQFGLIARSEALCPEDLRFEVVGPNADPADMTRRPYVTGVYVPRLAVSEVEMSDAAQASAYSEGELRSLLEEGRSILLIGKPTEGKTRTLYEIARGLKGYVVVQPKNPLPSPEAMELLRGQKVLCLFDDINTSVEKQIDLFEFFQQVQQVASYGALAAACRDGNELVALKLKLSTSPVQRLYECFTDRFVLRPASPAEKGSLARQLKRPDDDSYLSLGDVSMRNAFELMRLRFDNLEELDRECLWAVQLLAEGGVEQLLRPRILAVLKHQYGRDLKLVELRPPLMRLRSNGFLLGGPGDDPIVAEAAFVSGVRARRNYREGLEPAADLPLLIEALRKESDVGGLNGIAFRTFNAGDAQAAVALWSSTYETFASSADAIAYQLAVVAGVNVAIELNLRGENEEALRRYEEIVQRFGSDTLPRMREQVAKALFNSGVTLGKLGLEDKELSRYSEVVQRYQGDGALDVLEIVATAFFNSGKVLFRLGRYEKALQSYVEVISRYEGESTPNMRAFVANAVLERGLTLSQLGRREEAIQRYADAVRRCESKTAPGFREIVAKSLCNEGLTLGQLNRHPDALRLYAEVVERFESDGTLVLREQVAGALVSSGCSFGALNLYEEELQRYVEVVEAYDEEIAPVIRENVAKARVNSCIALGQLDRFEEALHRCEDTAERYKGDIAPEVREQAARALITHGNTFAQLKCFEKALKLYAEVVQIYDVEDSPAMREVVATALVNSCSALHQLGRHLDTIQGYMAVLERYEHDDLLGTSQMVLHARNALAEMVITMLPPSFLGNGSVCVES